MLAADDRHRGHTEQHTRLEQVRERVREVVERTDEVRRDEAHDEVGVVARERVDDLARGLTDRVRGDGMLRMRCGIARHVGHGTGNTSAPRPGRSRARR